MTDFAEEYNLKQKLKESEKKFRQIFDKIPDLFFIVDEKGTHLEFKGNEDLLYLKPQMFLGKTIDETLPDDLAKKYLKAIKETLETQGMCVIEYSLSIHGKLHYYEARNLYFSKNRVAIFVRDITQRKETEQMLKESEEIFRIIAEQSFMGIIILQDDQIKYVNEAVEKICEYRVADILNWSKDYLAKKCIHPEDLPMLVEKRKLRRAGKFNIKPYVSYRVITKSGKIKWIDQYSRMILYRGKDAELITIVDITDKKESEEKFQLLYENTPLSYQSLDENGRIIEVNRAWLDLLEYEKEEVIGQWFGKFLALKYRDRYEKNFLKFKKKGFTKGAIIEMIKKSGETIIVLINGKVTYNEDGTFRQTHCIIHDITAKRLAEKKLKESEVKFRGITEQSLLGICIYQDDTVQYLNQKMADIFEYTIDEILNWKPVDLNKIIAPEYRNLVLEQARKKQIGEQDVLKHYIFKGIKKKGEEIWLELYSKTIEYGGRNADLITLIDITGKRDAEQKLKESEGKYRNLLESSPMAIIEIDARTNQLSYVNPKLEKITGYSKEDLLDLSTMANFIHPLDFLDITRSTHDRELEFRITTKDGKLKWLSGNRVSQYNKKGELINLRLWLEDVTEKKIFNTLLFELNANFLKFGTEIQKNITLLLNTAQRLLNAEVVLYCREVFQDGNIQIQFTSSQNEIFEYDYDFFKENCFIYNLFKIDNDFPQILVSLNEFKSTKTDPIIQRYKVNAYYGKHIKPQKDLKSLICILYKENPDVSEKDQFILFSISTAIEIEERRWESLLKLEEQNKRLNEIHKLKSELFTRISHELKTPLLSIKGFTDLLLELYKDEFEESIISIFKEIDHGRERLEDIVNSFLETSQLDSGKMTLSKSRENLSFLINYCVNELKGLIHSRKQTIKLNLQENIIAEFDKEKIYEVIMNLLTNAIKNTPREGTIKIDSEIKNSSIITKVEDDGIGLTKEEMEQLFKKFGKIERYGKGWDVGIEGTGLGLYISKKIVELHGGKIWAESEGRNKGSKFYFSLPFNNS